MSISSNFFVYVKCVLLGLVLIQTNDWVIDGIQIDNREFRVTGAIDSLTARRIDAAEARARGVLVDNSRDIFSATSLPSSPTRQVRSSAFCLPDFKSKSDSSSSSPVPFSSSSFFSPLLFYSSFIHYFSAVSFPFSFLSSPSRSILPFLIPSFLSFSGIPHPQSKQRIWGAL